MKRIKVRLKDTLLEAELFNTKTAEKIYDALPLSGKVSTWGNELYFSIPVSCPLEDDATEEVPEGTIAYWPSGAALCIFFGRTPASTSDMPRAMAAVNNAGRIISDLSSLAKIKSGDVVSLEKDG